MNRYISEYREHKKLVITKSYSPTKKHELLKNIMSITELQSIPKISLQIPHMIAISSKKLSEYKYGPHNDNYLTYAIRFNNKEAVEYLLKREAITPLASNENNKNVLHFAVESENIDMLTYLCEGDWNSKFMDDNETFPMPEKDRKRWVEESWKALDVATISEGFRPFHLAVISGNKEILQYIAKITEYRRHQASIEDKKNQYMTFKEVLENKATGGMTPLLLAVYYNKRETFEYLLKQGANAYASNNKLQNALHMAVINKNPEIVRLLIKFDTFDSKLKSQIDYRGKTPTFYDKKAELHLVMTTIWEAINFKSLFEIHQLVQFRKNKYFEDIINSVRENDGFTPLHEAIYLGLPEIARLLIELGADISVQNLKGQNALDLAKEEKDEEKRELLMQAISLSPDKKIILAKMQQSLTSSKTLKRNHYKGEDINKPIGPNVLTKSNTDKFLKK